MNREIEQCTDEETEKQKEDKSIKDGSKSNKKVPTPDPEPIEDGSEKATSTSDV